jgi:hypothetical protein
MGRTLEENEKFHTIAFCVKPYKKAASPPLPDNGRGGLAAILVKIGLPATAFFTPNLASHSPHEDYC